MTMLGDSVSEDLLKAYYREGERRVLTLGNRGPLHFTAGGALHPDIVEAYERVGLYIFEGVIAPPELAELKAEFHAMFERTPTARDSVVDRHGRPALGLGREPSVFSWSKPLGDPYGGTGMLNGRHPVKMFEPKPAEGLPAEIVYGIRAPLQFSDAYLRVCGHPGLLSVAAAVNGEDFVPFSEFFVIKKPGEGSAFAWHQDGMTHWSNPAWDPQIHGFNFMIQLYESAAHNGLWYLPGSHAKGKADIAAMARRAGGNLIPQTVPLIAKPGDVAISNRQIVHGSFPNTSQDWRVSFNFGFHRRSSVVGAQFRLNDGPIISHSEERVRKRAEMIGFAIAARRQRFPGETPFVYRPHEEAAERYDWSEAARAEIMDYHALDLGI